MSIIISTILTIQSLIPISSFTPPILIIQLWLLELIIVQWALIRIIAIGSWLSLMLHLMVLNLSLNSWLDIRIVLWSLKLLLLLLVSVLLIGLFRGLVGLAWLVLDYFVGLLFEGSLPFVVGRAIGHCDSTSGTTFLEAFVLVVVSSWLLLDWLLFYIVLVINMSANISIHLLLRRRPRIRHRNIISTRSRISSRRISRYILLTSIPIRRRCLHIIRISPRIIVSHLLVVISLSGWHLLISISSNPLLSLLCFSQSFVEGVFVFLFELAFLLFFDLGFEVGVFAPPGGIDLGV